MPTLEHLIALSDDTGVIQHALEDVPNRSTGYCTDDVARAFIVALKRLELEPRSAPAKRLASTYLAFLADAQLADGRFHNFMSYDRTWLDAVGTQDSVGRALWSLGFGMGRASRPSWRALCAQLFERGCGALTWLTHPRAQAYAAIGLAHALQSDPGAAAERRYRTALREIAAVFRERYAATNGARWRWFEDQMTYDNARLCEAVLRAGCALDEQKTVALGLRTLAFYERVVVENGVFVPIGNRGWYRRGGERARYAQQPLEAAAMVDAALAAHDATGDPAFVSLAATARDWYFGRNTLSISLVRNGGCSDGLEAEGANRNMGAESTLAFLAATYALAKRPARALRVAGPA